MRIQNESGEYRLYSYVQILHKHIHTHAVTPNIVYAVTNHMHHKKARLL